MFTLRRTIEMSPIQDPHSILITGATGGIGEALAHAYAQTGKVLILQGRNEGRLALLKAECEARGADVYTQRLDVRDRSALTNWLTEVCDKHLPDLIIVNAGVNTDNGADGSGEPWNEVEALVEVNILAVMATVNVMVPAMRSRGYGQIALVSSLAAWFGLPVTPSYSASKAAIKAYGEALRGWLYKDGIRVNVIMPGYVKSAMCDAMPGPKPFLWPAARAADKIRQSLAADKPRITFPFPLNLGTWFLAVMPASLSLRILRWLGYVHS